MGLSGRQRGRLWTRAVGAAAEALAGLSGQRGRRSGRGHDAVPTAPLWHGVLTGTGTWQPRGDNVLMSGPGAEREADR
jgi:hypothetical protein